ncbi:type II secretion system F family protein [Haloplasma contractile]|uniref:Pilin secretion-fimbrial assembly system protein PilC putative n=1 Tax=Haloplasma contractile SSD-17B TaxID=1033810 RepID=U2EFT7_9MOLU|nr:type II secretion system F family protein [Haloplasma contractile]ERJ13788.1 Pilin secretion-fimbrial assembly system protein PilC putative [Haloplasma contractile SSD-17B]
MNIRLESSFFNVLENFLDKGYSLHDSLLLMGTSFSKITNQMTTSLNLGHSFSETVKAMGFKRMTKELIQIGEQSNKINQAIRNINDYFELKIKLTEMINKILIYPIIVFTLAFFCFIFIEIRVLPIVSSLKDLETASLSDYILHFIAFNSLKVLIGIGVVVAIFHKVLPQLFNLLSIVKLFRSLYLCTTILLIVESGASLEESIKILSKFLNAKVYRLTQFKRFIITGTYKKDPLSCFHFSFRQFIRMGISANNLNSMLVDYKLCYTRILFQKLGHLVQSTQFFIFLILSINIFLIYYIIMIPMINLSGSI